VTEFESEKFADEEKNKKETRIVCS